MDRFHNRSRLLYGLFVVALCTLAVAQVLAVHFSLYYLHTWLDTPMHMLGGVALALGFLAFFHQTMRGGFWHGLLLTVSVVLAVGIAWEVYEFAAGSVLSETAPLRDTLGDIVADAVGAALGYVTARALAPLDI